MRPKERIKPFLEKVNWEKMIEYLFPDLDEGVKEEFLVKIFTNLQGIKTVWNINPDLRITQVLVNTDTIPNLPGFWYYREDEDILINQGYEPREVLLWGNNYDKDMNRLPKTKWILIKDLDTDHIEAILDGKYTRSSLYIKAFQDELKLRKL